MDDEDCLDEEFLPTTTTDKPYPLNVSRVISTFPSVTERYFDARFFVADPQSPVGDHCILFHSNRICIVTLAPSHPVLAEKKQPTSVTFRVNRLKNRVSGKFKKGGQKLLSNSVLCTIGCTDESNYTIYAGVKATLVEINEKIIDNPNIIAQEPWADGYIAILLPNINAAKSLKESLLSYDAYKTIVDRRQQQSVKNASVVEMDPVIT